MHSIIQIIKMTDAFVSYRLLSACYVKITFFFIKMHKAVLPVSVLVSRNFIKIKKRKREKINLRVLS